MHKHAPRINLRPWREELRQEMTKQLLVAIAFVVLVSGVLVASAMVAVNQLVAAQEFRNDFLNSEIRRLDRDLREIQELKNQRAKMIERMRVIQDLQGKRPIIVHVFDELAQVMPDDTFFEKMSIKTSDVSVDGIAGANNKVSALMRNIDGSPWFESPNLKAINAEPDYGDLASSFALTFNVVSELTLDEVEEGKK